MPILLPTKLNINALKSMLMSDFGMKSAHASESIAALMGFRTNVSFIKSSHSLSEVTAFDAHFDAFEDRSVELGYDRKSSEYLRLIYSNISWPEPAWKEFTRPNRSGRNAWFSVCEERKIPYMYLERGRTLSKFQWDHISATKDYDHLLRQNGADDLTELLLSRFQLICRGTSPKAYFDGNAFVGEVTGLTDLDARIIANVFTETLFPGNLQARLATQPQDSNSHALS